MGSLIAIGSAGPSFRLPDLDGIERVSDEARGRLLVLNFWSAECPWAERADSTLLAALPEWGDQVLWWTIAVNANETDALIRSEAARRGLPCVLLDARQEAADVYGAQTTPHLFVVDESGILRYQGALDDVTFRRRTPSVNYVHLAVESLLSGRQPEIPETSPYGCTIVRRGYR